ncbi:MAG: hypothetical protein LBQ66_14240 [Planctomycetaceae bacterium]|jgi:hypothetical protein|nr:hypothetical protein [Planctomycetaceae bacterium]
MFKKLVFGGLFVLAVSCSVYAQGNAAKPELLAENRLEVELADIDRPPVKGLTPSKEHVGTIPKGLKLGRLTKEKRSEITNLEKEYAKIIDFLQIRIDLLKAERDKKIKALAEQKNEESTTNEK